MEPNLASPFTAQEFSNGIAALKNGKAIGLDGISTEELKHFSQQAKNGCLNCLIDAWKPIVFPTSGGNHALLLSKTRQRPFIA